MTNIIYHEIAKQVGTPCYAYDQTIIERNYRTLANAFNGCGIYYAVKANSNLAVLRLLHDLGCGFDVVSVGEMHRALKAGASPADVVFAGVGKRDDELLAALDAGIGWINVESAEELRVLSDIAFSKGMRPNVALRINPAVDPHTHQYLATGKGSSKFGINVEPALALVAERVRYPGVNIAGVHAHIGSFLFEPSTYAQTMQVLLDFVGDCRNLGAELSHVDVGGGFGVAYESTQQAMNVSDVASLLMPMARNAGVNMQIEPGRYLVAESGVLLSRVLYTKQNGDKHYVVVDAAMNDLIRPALYGAYHQVSKVYDVDTSAEAGGETLQNVEVVGPVCESGDFLAHSAALPPVKRGDLLAIHHTGAYGFAMSSNYNSRPRSAEVMYNAQGWRIVRRRETLDALLADEI
jgi:diaminopimelate decarboxylase